MFNFNKLLKNANLYSIEYCGYFIFKFAISNELVTNVKIQDIKIEFNIGCAFIDTFELDYSFYTKVLNLYGKNIVNVLLIVNNHLLIEFDNGYKIISTNNEIDNNLIDRYWVISDIECYENYIFNDMYNIFIADSMAALVSA